MVFPDKGVRFIAINDNVDSDNHNQGDDILIPVKNLINESYCSELSKKLRAQFRLQRRNGEFLGAFASYGYCKSVEDKHKLVIDDYAAEIVRSIFSFKMQGYSQQATLDELDAWSAVIRNYQRVPVIDRRLVDMLVKKILVFHDKSIHSNPTSSRDVPQRGMFQKVLAKT